MNITNCVLRTTQDKCGDSIYTAVLSLKYGTVAATAQIVGPLSFTGNSDLFQMQSLMAGIGPMPARNIQLAFWFDTFDAGGIPGNLVLYMPDTGELITVDPKNGNSVFNGACLSVNILPSYQVLIGMTENAGLAMVGQGVITLSTKERESYWS